MALSELRTMLAISGSDEITRRYFVVNGFDGALAMLGLLAGFNVSGQVPLSIVITSCLATALALAMSGVSSAYISESAERRRSLNELEEAMVSPLPESHHARAASWVPWLVAVVNGAAPMLFALLIIAPLWLAENGLDLHADPLFVAGGVAFVIIFLLGVFLGRVGGTFWLWSGLRSLAVGATTIALILLVSR